MFRTSNQLVTEMIQAPEIGQPEAPMCWDALPLCHFGAPAEAPIGKFIWSLGFKREVTDNDPHRAESAMVYFISNVKSPFFDALINTKSAYFRLF